MDLSKIAIVAPLPAAPKIGSAAEKAISAIKDGHQVFCQRGEYEGSVRQAIINQADIWMAHEEISLVKVALSEIKRLDGQYGIARNVVGS